MSRETLLVHSSLASDLAWAPGINTAVAPPDVAENFAVAPDEARRHTGRAVGAAGLGLALSLSGCGTAAPGEAGGYQGTATCPGQDTPLHAAFGKFDLVNGGKRFHLRYDGTSGVNGDGPGSLPKGYEYSDGRGGSSLITKGDARGDIVVAFKVIVDEAGNNAVVKCLAGEPDK